MDAVNLLQLFDLIEISQLQVFKSQIQEKVIKKKYVLNKILSCVFTILNR